MNGNKTIDRIRPSTSRHILTDKNGIPISAIITSTSTHDVKAVTDIVDNIGFE
jgi:hypothetical protein